jgi:HSP20 family protein
MTIQTPAKSASQGVQPAPIPGFAPIQREFNRLFDELTSGWSSFAAREMAPRLDVRETKKAVELTFEVPGISEADVKVAIEGDLLTVSGEKKAEKETKEDNYRLSERSYGAFSRSITLPPSVDADAIKATMADGVLKIVAPKKPGVEAKAIKIQTK